MKFFRPLIIGLFVSILYIIYFIILYYTVEIPFWYKVLIANVFAYISWIILDYYAPAVETVKDGPLYTKALILDEDQYQLITPKWCKDNLNEMELYHLSRRGSSRNGQLSIAYCYDGQVCTNMIEGDFGPSWKEADHLELLECYDSKLNRHIIYGYLYVESIETADEYPDSH